MMVPGKQIIPLVLFSLAAFHTAARADGVEWSDLSLDEALAKAEEANTLVIIDVFSDHCGQCKDMDTDLWNTPEGAELAEGLIALRIASDKPEGIPLQRRYPIIGLPVVLFLQPDGTELDRVAGFRSVKKFLEEAHALKAGFDPLPMMEEELEANPSSLQLLVEVLEKYLYRRREAEAESLLQRMLHLDSKRKAKEPRKALMFMAKYHSYFHRDKEKSQEYWRTLIEQYAGSPAVSSGVKATYEYARSRGKLQDWIEWICGVIAENPGAGRLNYYTARIAHRGGLTHPCLAQAARTAHALGVGPANLDSIAVILEGKPAKPED